VSEHVILAGPLPRPEVVRRMNASHILLVPSVTAADGNQEGLPVVIMEAMATGLPVVTTRHTGIPELVVHRSTGMLVEERDVDELTDALRELLEDAELYGRVARRGRRAVEEKHDVKRLNDQLMMLLAGSSPQAGAGTLPPTIAASTTGRTGAGVR
jgi:colanic acid/amylovoran biosynthesis glycosyltransferase